MPYKNPQQLRDYQRRYRQTNRLKIRNLKLNWAKRQREQPSTCACGERAARIVNSEPVCLRCLAAER